MTNGEQLALPDGLPAETRDPATGALLCRHHGRPIRATAEPCSECWLEVRGTFAPIEEEGDHG
jgi:hypothetical protein